MRTARTRRLLVPGAACLLAFMACGSDEPVAPPPCEPGPWLYVAPACAPCVDPPGAPQPEGCNMIQVYCIDRELGCRRPTECVDIDTQAISIDYCD